MTGLPLSTVHRWHGDLNTRVHAWQDIARIARALGLDRAQTSELLVAAGQPALAVLERWGLEASDRVLLATWPNRLPPSSLPARLSRFIGRVQEQEDLTALLASERLVTISGTGGTGKTALALEVAPSIQAGFDGAYFIDLAAVQHPDVVLSAIADAIGCHPSQDEPLLPALVAHLQGYDVLLVLDNVEHLREAGPQIVAVQQGAIGVRALVTSRTPLRVRGERDYLLDPLPPPDPEARYADLARNPAVALFVDRAKGVDQRFRLTAANAAAIARICASLDGLPLAIELAAARMRELPLSRMQEQLSSRLDLASKGPSDAVPRQSTLRETIAWSCSLLDAETQRWFALLGVFVGGFTREAMLAIGPALGLDAGRVTPALMSLVSHRLVRKAPAAKGTVVRYTMLETLREYALERLAASGEEAATRDAHARFLLALAERADLEGGRQAFWLPRFVDERDNTRAGLEWCLRQGDLVTGLRLTLALMPFWLLQDRRREASGWLDAFEPAESAVAPELRARALLWRGLFLMRATGDARAALPRFDGALALFEDSGDDDGAGEVLQAQGDAARRLGDWREARRRYARSLELAIRTGNAHLRAHAYMGLAFCAQEEGQFEDAERFWTMTLEWAERSGNRGTVALVVNSLGEMARYRRRWEEARGHYERALAMARELGSDFRIALALHNLAYVALATDGPAGATDLFLQSLHHYELLQYPKGEAECLAGLAKVAVAEGQWERAARLCGAASGMLDALHSRLDTLDRADYERTLEVLERQLGERLPSLLALGAAMRAADALAYARAFRQSGSSDPAAG